MGGCKFLQGPCGPESLHRSFGVVTLSQTELNLPTTANLDARDFIDLACWFIVQTGPISLNVTKSSGFRFSVHTGFK